MKDIKIVFCDGLIVAICRKKESRLAVQVVASQKMAVFWFVASYSQVDVDRQKEDLTASIVRTMNL
jgi:hypothetical protein